MDRASDYGSEGWGFESLRAHSVRSPARHRTDEGPGGSRRGLRRARPPAGHPGQYSRTSCRPHAAGTRAGCSARRRRPARTASGPGSARTRPRRGRFDRVTALLDERRPALPPHGRRFGGELVVVQPREHLQVPVRAAKATRASSSVTTRTSPVTTSWREVSGCRTVIVARGSAASSAAFRLRVSVWKCSRSPRRSGRAGPSGRPGTRRARWSRASRWG